MTRQELITTLIQTVGPLIDARNKTLETNLKAYVDDVKRELKADITRVEKNLDEVKDEVKNDIYHLEGTITKRLDNHEDRIHELETSA